MSFNVAQLCRPCTFVTQGQVSQSGGCPIKGAMSMLCKNLDSGPGKLLSSPPSHCSLACQVERASSWKGVDGKATGALRGLERVTAAGKPCTRVVEGGLAIVS